MIICAGESLVDMVSFRGEPEYTPHVGGSNFNSSIALGRLGADSRIESLVMICFVSICNNLKQIGTLCCITINKLESLLNVG